MEFVKKSHFPDKAYCSPILRQTGLDLISSCATSRLVNERETYINMTKWTAKEVPQTNNAAYPKHQVTAKSAPIKTKHNKKQSMAKLSAVFFATDGQVIILLKPSI